VAAAFPHLLHCSAASYCPPTSSTAGSTHSMAIGKRETYPVWLLYDLRADRVHARIKNRYITN